MSNKNHHYEEEQKHQKVEVNIDDNQNENVQSEEKEVNAEAQEQTPEEKLQTELEAAQKETAELKDKYLRLSAEFDNYRKRTLKEKAELIKNGGEKAITSILPILDDLERALQNMEKWNDVKAMHEGIDLIYQKFLKGLSQQGLEKMEPIGENFDTDFHEAVALIPAPEESQKGKVLDCVQTGYKLNDKVIRHAKVVVAQ